ncbi:TPA: hypothetical protein EYP26_03565 [Candidatus Bathyarchaeota archaeon]|nr:hypothetical protein [Candidatus Bathyarchaeota archaeon]
MKPPCVLVVGRVLPALRVLVAKRLMEEHNLKLVDAARRMDVTPSAITQYVKGARGYRLPRRLKANKALEEAVNSIAEELVKDKVNMENVLKKICNTCEAIRSEELLCEDHIETLPSLKNFGCRLCLREGEKY